MSNVEKLSVALTTEMAAMVRDAVQSGQYASSSEVIREALRDWQFNHQLRAQRVTEIRDLWNEGIESGRSSLSSFIELKAAARNRARG